MKASELLGRPVLGADATALGVVHDLRVVLPPAPAGDDPRADRTMPGTSRGPVVVGLVVGPDTLRCRLAHSWGYAQGRTRGPALLRALATTGGSYVRTVPVEDVASWDDGGRVRLRGGAR